MAFYFCSFSGFFDTNSQYHEVYSVSGLLVTEVQTIYGQHILMLEIFREDQ